VVLVAERLERGPVWRRAVSEVWMQQSVMYCGALCCRQQKRGDLIATIDSVSRAWVQIADATVSGNSLRQTVHTQAAKLVAALLRVAGVTAGLAESNGSLPPGL